MDTSNANSTFLKRLDNLASAIKTFTDTLESTPHDYTLVTEARTHAQTAEKNVSIKDNLNLGTIHTELDIQGTRLWNLTTVLLRESEGQGKEIALEARVLACYTLDCSWARGDLNQDLVRLFKVAVKTGKMLCEADRHAEAARVFERAAKYHDMILQKSSDPSAEQETGFSRTMSDYLICRMALAWKQSSLGLADSLYQKAATHFSAVSDVQAVEKFSDALLKLGKDLLAQNAYDRAITWLQRAHDVVSKIEPELILEDAQELRLGIIHSLAKGYITRKADGDFEKAHSLVEIMIQDWPLRIVVFLMKFDLLEAEGKENPVDYQQVINKMIQVVQISDSSLKSVMSKVHALASKSPKLACECTDELLLKRLLLLSDKDEWIEQTFVTRLWITVQDPKTVEDSHIKSIISLLDSMERRLAKPLSPTTTHSSQILLWKVSQSFFIQEKFAECATWCRALLHPIFDRSATANVGKIARRLITCALNEKNYDEAKSVFDSMPELEKETISSQFLLFKLALRKSDFDIAEKCIETICEHPSQDYRALYACILDAEELDNKKVALQGLRKVVTNLEKFSADSLHIPTLLRCNISLTISEMGNQFSQDQSQNAESICEIFEKAADFAKRSRSSRTRLQEASFKVEELEWFSRSAYNLALRSMDEWGESISLRLLKSCLDILALFPSDIDSQTRIDISLRKLYCYYLGACLRIELARGESEIDTQEDYYLNVCESASDFRKLWLEVQDSVQETERRDLKKKYGTVLVLEFEARIHLKSWDALGAIIDAAELCEDTKVLECLGDLVLRSKAPHRTMIAILRKILTRSEGSGSADPVKLAAFLRCQLSIALLSEPKIVDTLVKQIVQIKRNAPPGFEYPREELHWVSATLWNRAVDYHSASDRENFRKAGEWAMTVGGLIDDDFGRKYLQQLQEIFLAMNMDA